MTAFLISVAKALICFVAICIGLGVLMLVWVVVREAAWVVKHENRNILSRRKKIMKMAAFKAVCPLELGDTVAVTAPKAAGEPKEAYYLPDGHMVILSGAVSIHKVTDILTLHFLKK